MDMDIRQDLLECVGKILKDGEYNPMSLMEVHSMIDCLTETLTEILNDEWK